MGREEQPAEGMRGEKWRFTSASGEFTARGGGGGTKQKKNPPQGERQRGGVRVEPRGTPYVGHVFLARLTGFVNDKALPLRN